MSKLYLTSWLMYGELLPQSKLSKYIYSYKTAKLYAIQQQTCWKWNFSNILQELELTHVILQLSKQNKTKRKNMSTTFLDDLELNQWLVEGPCAWGNPTQDKRNVMLHIFLPRNDFGFKGSSLTIHILIDPLCQMLGFLKSSYHHSHRWVEWNNTGKY